MYLKQIEVMGFKSFAKKTAIDFVPGVTAVVGPNGSGKSNITDAIRWVLGEQSARSLRGAKMEDIIFAGSDSKKPLNIAEVTLTLDNSDHYLPYDYSEISVTRRVYRSGDSDFLLNGQTCRLKDIVELFMDSGLGREAYSIISQGKIDDILNSKAEEKRKIFEEAAGVFKYKSRKQTAEKKLSEADDNLLRIEDIRNELEGQIEPLAEQASIAEEYLDKKDQLEMIEVGLLAHDINQSHQNWELLNQKVDELKDKELGLSTAIQTKESDYEAKLVYIQGLDESIEELQDSLLLTSELLEKLEGEKKVLNERQKHAKEHVEQLTQQMTQLTTDGENNQKRLAEEKLKYDTESNTLTHLKEKLEASLRHYQNYEQDLESMLENLKSDYFDLLNQQATFRNEIRYLGEQKTQLDKKKGRLTEEHEQLQPRVRDFTDRRTHLNALLEAKQDELEQSRSEFQQLKIELTELNQTYEKQRASSQQMTQIIHQAESRKAMLEEMNQDYTGFFHGVKQVLKARNTKLSGIEGAIAELIKVKKEHEVAIEIALGGGMQSIVVQNEQNAREAINYLKKTQSGRATFLPISVVKPRFIQEISKIKQHPSFIGVASDLISFDKKYNSVIGHLLGHIIIASDLKGANDIAREVGHRYRIVTLDGDVISPGGSMTGGSQKQKTGNLLARKREVEQLTKQIKEMKAQHQALEKKLHENKEKLTSLTASFEQLREKGQSLQMEKQELEGTFKEIKIEENNLKDRLAILNREKDDITAEVKQIDERLKSLEQGQADNKNKEVQLKSEIDEVTEKKKHQEDSKSELQSMITDLKVQVAEQQQKVQFQKEELKRVEEAYHHNQMMVEKTKEELELVGRSASDHAMDKDSLEEKIIETRNDKEAITKWISERRKERFDLHGEVQAQERELKEEKRLYKGLSEALRSEEIALSRLDVQLDNLLKQLSEDYELTFESAKENYPLTMEVDEARKQVKLIKRAIEELGTVNLGAIEEYQRVSTRYQFLTEQREDLLEAKKTLLNVINEMDQEVEKRFKETFYHVQEHFRVIFKELFGGGQADLCLTDPEDMLNTGVDILAQPPGKKLQHLSLLSGGERALTAIALLFAILKVRPVPFCVLDEVEAALDEANVHRYATYLKVFSQESQFIVVTHRKGTMEQADVLYGVTMQESGVSNLVSVRLEESKELVEAN